MNFKIGQKVVCKSTENEPGVLGVVKGIKCGVIYTICGFDKCEFCNSELVLLAGVNTGNRKECQCSHIPIFPTNAFMSYRFEPLKHNTIAEHIDTIKKETLKLIK
jgi:hypothetical protein